MLFFGFLLFIIVIYIVCDFNYLIRTCFTVISGCLYQNTCSLSDITEIYGLGTFQDCDIFFRSVRLARLVRELDFARYHFYDRTGVYQRSRQIGIKSLQGSTLTISFETLPLFVPYKIKTKLVFWDERSLFFEHEVVTLHDSKTRCFLISRQYALGKDKNMVYQLLKDLPGSKEKPQCPENIKNWLQSMNISSENLRMCK